MARIRGILIDNSTTNGSMYTNLSTPSDAINAPAHNLAVIKNNQFTVQTKPQGAAVQLVTDNTGWRAPNVVTLTKIIPTLRAAPGVNPCPVGNDLIVSIRKLDASSSGTSVVAVINVPAASTAAVIVSTAVAGNAINCVSTSSLSVGMPIVFNAAIGNIKVKTTYYVLSIVSATIFTVSLKLNGPAVVQKAASVSTYATSMITSITSNVNITLLAGDIMYTDVTQVGSTSPGMGLITYFNYY